MFGVGVLLAALVDRSLFDRHLPWWAPKTEDAEDAIHGAIIARELGIPCVNGIPHAVELLEEGEIVTVDGYLGIVTVGAPEFDLEAG